jgi:hypothetical protein
LSFFSLSLSLRIALERARSFFFKAEEAVVLFLKIVPNPKQEKVLQLP